MDKNFASGPGCFHVDQEVTAYFETSHRFFSCPKFPQRSNAFALWAIANPDTFAGSNHIVRRDLEHIFKEENFDSDIRRDLKRIFKEENLDFDPGYVPKAYQ